ncbi:hypothetical protein PLESTF_000218500 [Pleodorina starrii]|nr:hypothetical protein PLESTF_000218500 [Pleodorina starrii]
MRRQGLPSLQAPTQRRLPPAPTRAPPSAANSCRMAGQPTAPAAAPSTAATLPAAVQPTAAPAAADAALPAAAPPAPPATVTSGEAAWRETCRSAVAGGRGDDSESAQPPDQPQPQQQSRQERQASGLLAGRRQLLMMGGAGALFGGAANDAAGVGSTAAAAAPAGAGACPPAVVGSGATGFGAIPRGWRALRDPAINRGLATTVAVRQQYGLEGLLPARVTAPAVEVARAAAAVQRAEVAAAAAAAAVATDGGGGGGGASLLPYCTLMALREADKATFFALVQQDVERYLPLIYTPAVGDACLAWGSLLPRPTGLSISLGDAGRVARLVDNWAAGQPQARIAVLTDGERILGLGDLGAHGLGIPVGKAAVYGAAGVDPDWILPVALDVGCNTESVVGGGIRVHVYVRLLQYGGGCLREGPEVAPWP